MSAEGMLDRLNDWIETSGRALELRTARMFREQRPAPWFVNQSVTYEDVRTHQQREGDVQATYRWTTHDRVAMTFHVCVETKSSKENPWVAFYDDRRFVPNQSDYWFLRGGQQSGGGFAALLSEWQRADALATDRVATHVVSAFGKDGKNLAHDAARQALSFARSLAVDNVRYVGDRDDMTVTQAAIPVVITQAPLVTCELDDRGQVILSNAERFDMWVHLSRTEKRRVYVRSEHGAVPLAAAVGVLASRLGGSTSP